MKLGSEFVLPPTYDCVPRAERRQGQGSNVAHCIFALHLENTKAYHEEISAEGFASKKSVKSSNSNIWWPTTRCNSLHVVVYNSSVFVGINGIQVRAS